MCAIRGRLSKSKGASTYFVRQASKMFALRGMSAPLDVTGSYLGPIILQVNNFRVVDGNNNSHVIIIIQKLWKFIYSFVIHFIDYINVAISDDCGRNNCCFFLNGIIILLIVIYLFFNSDTYMYFRQNFIGLCWNFFRGNNYPRNSEKGNTFKNFLELV